MSRTRTHIHTHTRLSNTAQEMGWKKARKVRDVGASQNPQSASWTVTEARLLDAGVYVCMLRKQWGFFCFSGWLDGPTVSRRNTPYGRWVCRNMGFTLELWGVCWQGLVHFPFQTKEES